MRKVVLKIYIPRRLEGKKVRYIIYDVDGKRIYPELLIHGINNLKRLGYGDLDIRIAMDYWAVYKLHRRGCIYTLHYIPYGDNTLYTAKLREYPDRCREDVYMYHLTTG